MSNRVKKVFKIRQSRMFILAFISCVVLLSVYPALRSNVLNTDDIKFHLLRIESIKEGILSGNFRSEIHSVFLNGYGYGCGLFYPDLFLYVPALMRVLGIGISVSYNLFVVVVTVFTAISTYFSAKYMTKSRFASLIATALFVLSQYRSHNLHIRGAVGEYVAMIFVPVIICGIYDLLYRDFENPWIIGLGFLGTFLSHTISFAASFVITLIILLFNVKKVMKKSLMCKLLVTGIIVMLVSSFFWVPCVEQFLSASFQVSQNKENLKGFALSIPDIFRIEYFGLGTPFIILLFLRMLVSKKIFKDDMRLPDGLVFIGLILLALTTKVFPWGRFNNTPLKFLQFPWRLLGFSSIFLSFGIAMLCNKQFVKRGQRVLVLTFVFTLTSIFSVVVNSFTWGVLEISNDIYSDPKRTLSMGSMEWLPVGTNVDFFLSDSDRIILDSGDKIECENKNCVVSFKLSTDSKYFDVPLLYYKGYSAVLVSESGDVHDLKVEKSSNNNLVRVLNPQRLKGNVRVRYAGTLAQKLSCLVSIVSVFAVSIRKLIRVTSAS